jgi:DNA-directed RNA polymerase specialized sigma24 family protein
MERALARMPPVRREIFRAVRFGGMNIEEAAQGQGIGTRRAGRELASAVAELDRALHRSAPSGFVRWLRRFR